MLSGVCKTYFRISETSNGFSKWINKLKIVNNSVINVLICQVRDHEIEAHRSISSDVDDQRHFNRIASFCPNLREWSWKFWKKTLSNTHLCREVTSFLREVLAFSYSSVDQYIIQIRPARGIHWTQLLWNYSGHERSFWLELLPL